MTKIMCRCGKEYNLNKTGVALKAGLHIQLRNLISDKHGIEEKLDADDT